MKKQQLLGGIINKYTFFTLWCNLKLFFFFSCQEQIKRSDALFSQATVTTYVVKIAQHWKPYTFSKIALLLEYYWERYELVAELLSDTDQSTSQTYDSHQMKSPFFLFVWFLFFVFLCSVIFVQAQWNPHWINKNNAAICVFSSSTCIPYGANLKTTFVHWISDGSLHEKGQLVQRIVVL